MSYQATAQESVPVQAAHQSPKVPLLVQYKMQLESLTKQREQAKIHFEQLNGAVFICEQMINQYEENAKQGALELVKKVSDSNDALKTNENLGAINDGQTHDETAKQFAKK